MTEELPPLIPAETKLSDLIQPPHISTDPSPALLAELGVTLLPPEPVATTLPVLDPTPTPPPPVTQLPSSVTASSAVHEETVQEKIARLQREVAEGEQKVAEARAAQAVRDRPTPESELTPEERQLRELEDRQAKQKAALLESNESELENASGPQKITIHILKDGMTFAGQVWYRGQEVDYYTGSQAYEETFDRLGHSWLEMAGRPQDQFRKWGEVRIGLGPWPGLASEDPIVLAAEARRGRRAPLLPN